MRPVRAAIAALIFSAALIEAAAPRLYLQSSTDQQAFRRWFTFMAESRYYAHKHVREISSCAALVRWAFRQALLPHDATWARHTDLPVFPVMRSPAMRSPAMRSVEEFDRMSNTGTAGIPNLARPAVSSDVSSLRREAAWFVGREVAEAVPGDLLFFADKDGIGKDAVGKDGEGKDRAPEHVMIYLGSSQIVPSNRKWAVYATDSGREIRKVCIDELSHGSADNEVFLGVWRLNILRDSP